MNCRTIFITEYDAKRLKELVEDLKRLRRARRGDWDGLETELGRGHLVSPQDVPKDVITMNSRVRLIDLDTGEKMTYTLVFPNDADIDRGKISVLAPIGTAMLGYRVGDIFEWQVPEGMRRLRVEKVLYQPEASGDYNL